MNARRPDVIHPLSDPVTLRDVCMVTNPCAVGRCRFCGGTLYSAVRGMRSATDNGYFVGTCGACAKARQ